MNYKDFKRTEKSLLKHLKQKRALKKQNKKYEKIIIELQEQNEFMENNMSFPDDIPSKVEEVITIKYTENPLNTIFLVLITFLYLKFLKCTQYNNTYSKYIDMDYVAYTMLFLHIVYVSLYYQYKLSIKS